MSRRVTSRRVIGAVVCLSVAAVACNEDGELALKRSPETVPPPADAPPQGVEGETAIARDLFERANDERRARDLEPVEWDEQLTELAEEWSREMADIGLQHRELDVELIRDRLDGFVGVGENIFSATGPVPAGQAHVGWMESDGHRANLLAPQWDRLGIGVHCAADGAVYATQNFGRTAPVGGGATDMTQDVPPAEPIARPGIDGPSCP
jgi:uncharacterized protein YkwD